MIFSDQKSHAGHPAGPSTWICWFTPCYNLWNNRFVPPILRRVVKSRDATRPGPHCRIRQIQGGGCQGPWPCCL